MGQPPHRFVFSTWPPSDTDATNETRKALGLRLIDANGWYFYGMKTFEDKTREASWKTSKDGYECKQVAYAADGTLTWEEDLYYTGRTFQSVNDPDAGTCSEFLDFHYDYLTKTAQLHYSGQDKEVFALAGLSAEEPGGSFQLGDMMQALSFDGLKALRDRIIAHWVAIGVLPAGTVADPNETASTTEELKGK